MSLDYVVTEPGEGEAEVFLEMEEYWSPTILYYFLLLDSQVYAWEGSGERENLANNYFTPKVYSTHSTLQYVFGVSKNLLLPHRVFSKLLNSVHKAVAIVWIGLRDFIYVVVICLQIVWMSPLNKKKKED